MRILVCNYEFPPVGGGGGNACRYLAREWVQQGHEVTVLTSHWRRARAEEEAEGARVIRVPVRRRRLDYTLLSEMAAYAWQGRGEARRLHRGGEGFEAVVTFFVIPSGPVGELASRLFGAPHLIRVGGGDLPGHQERFGLLHRLLVPVVRGMLRRAQVRIANSRGLKARAEAAHGLDFEVVENGVDLDEFTPGAEGPVHDPAVVLFVSRLIERKGLQFLLPALATPQALGLGWRLMVVGDGPRRKALEGQARDLGLAGRVEWLGQVAHEELPELYRRADVFVLPSLSEGMPNVVLEAMAAGLPVVATRVPGSEELVGEGENGLLVEPRDVAGLGEAVVRVLGEEELRRGMGRASRERAAGYGWAALARRYVRLMEALLRDGRSA